MGDAAPQGEEKDPITTESGPRSTTQSGEVGESLITPQYGSNISESPPAVSARCGLEDESSGDLVQTDGAVSSSSVDGALPAAVHQALREQLAAGISPEQLQRALRAIPSPLDEKGTTPAKGEASCMEQQLPGKEQPSSAGGALASHSGAGDGESPAAVGCTPMAVHWWSMRLTQPLYRRNILIHLYEGSYSPHTHRHTYKAIMRPL
jgi:hypothetical protein